MGWFITGAVDEFLAEAGDFLHAEPVRHTVILSVTENLRAKAARNAPYGSSRTAHLFGWRRASTGPVCAAFMQTPDFPVFLTSMTSSAAAELAVELAGKLSGKLAASGPGLVSGVNAERQAAEAFAAAWRHRTGDAATVQRHMRLHRLDELAWPDPGPDGAPRVAGERDRELLIKWLEAFTREVEEPPGQDHAAAAEERLSYGGVTVWEADGVPVSIAGVTRAVGEMARIGPVYTPPSLRGRGYAGAATAAVSQAALDAGVTDVLLYTDLANPTSNSLYQRLGFRPVEDRLVLDFQRAQATLQR